MDKLSNIKFMEDYFEITYDDKNYHVYIDELYNTSNLYSLDNYKLNGNTSYMIKKYIKKNYNEQLEGNDKQCISKDAVIESFTNVHKVNDEEITTLKENGDTFRAYYIVLCIGIILLVSSIINFSIISIIVGVLILFVLYSYKDNFGKFNDEEIYVVEVVSYLKKEYSGGEYSNDYYIKVKDMNSIYCDEWISINGKDYKKSHILYGKLYIFKNLNNNEVKLKFISNK